MAVCGVVAARSGPNGNPHAMARLPPPAPHLNRIERPCWLFTKKTPWNTRHPALADFRTAIRGFFANIGHWQAELAPLPASRFHIIGHKTTQISAAQGLIGQPPEHRGRDAAEVP